MNATRTEKGQALVLIVLAIMGMMGFAALAVDGGMLYAERRRAQNAADAAAMAAALGGVQGKSVSQIQTIAENVMKANGYTPGTDAAVSVSGSSDLYTVKVDITIRPVFSQFIFSGGLPMTTEAVARGKGGNSASNPSSSLNAIHGLDPDGNSVRFNGGITVKVNTGNIYAKNILDKDGGNAGGTPKAGVYMENGGKIYYSGSQTGSTDGYWNGAAEDPGKTPLTPEKVAVQDDPVIAEPACPGNAPAPVTTGHGNSTVTTYKPGTYTSNVNTPNNDVRFEAGMYCFMNGIRINGNGIVTTVDASGNVLERNGTTRHVQGVLFVVKGGEVRINGNARIELLRADSIVDANGQQFGGLLLWSATSDVVLIGGSNSIFEGTIYAPQATCEFGGNSVNHIHGNAICNLVWAHGNTITKFLYAENDNYQIKSIPIVELVK